MEKQQQTSLVRFATSFQTIRVHCNTLKVTIASTEAGKESQQLQIQNQTNAIKRITFYFKQFQHFQRDVVALTMQFNTSVARRRSVMRGINIDRKLNPS